MARGLDLVYVPYDSGKRDWRMGRGPGHIRSAGLSERLGLAGFDVAEAVIEATDGSGAEIATTFDLHRRTVEEIGRVRREGRIPVLFAGNCNFAVAGAATCGVSRLGVVWFDAHGDFCTPETTTSGFLDGMGLAMLTGRCWTAMTAQTPGFRTVADDRVVLVGARDFDAAEREAFEASGIELIGPEAIREHGAAEALAGPLANLASRVDGVYVHVDLDVHDPAMAPANHYLTPNGLRPAEVRDCIASIAASVSIVGAGFGSYDPDYDPDGVTCAAALDLAEDLAGSMAR